MPRSNRSAAACISLFETEKAHPYIKTNALRGPTLFREKLPPLKALTRLKRPPVLKRGSPRFVGGGSREALFRFSARGGLQPVTDPL